ncbi:hypothetical protein LG307_14690 [Sutcliffiella horikoshii]|uniref:hypothetical protein n=1 Tax=Sutcliffiella horikoshii TaxID=79883 RepID=UPI00384DA22B
MDRKQLDNPKAGEIFVKDGIEYICLDHYVAETGVPVLTMVENVRKDFSLEDYKDKLAEGIARNIAQVASDSYYELVQKNQLPDSEKFRKLYIDTTANKYYKWDNFDYEQRFIEAVSDYYKISEQEAKEVLEKK